jgi:YD repeat-containing protein
VGQLEAVMSDWVDAQHPALLAGNFTYDASGALVSVEYGNGTVSTRSYNSGGQLKRLRHRTFGNPGSLLDDEYNYQETVANNGLVHGVIDWRDRSRDVSYTYDSYWRLATAQTAGSHWGLAWTYDRYGNRTAQTVTKGTAPAQTLAVSATTNRVAGWTYDGAGNTLNDGLHTYTYDAENRIRELDGGVAVYHYDGQGRRVMKVTATETIRYVLGVGEHSSVVGWKKLYVDLGREKLVEYSGGTTWFFHADHLGSPKVKTAVNGTEAERWDHYPYGETWVPGGSGDQHRYTGHLRDAESGNDFAGAVPATGAAIGRGPGVARASRPGWTVGADRPGPSPGKELPAGQENPSLDAG